MTVEWTPPDNPVPRTILREAEDDADAGRYELALAKHRWYHRYALRHDSGQTGVRLSFALSAWRDLGKRYPPAVEALKETRDRAADLVRAGKAVADHFADFQAINRELNESSRTVALFLELDNNDVEQARLVYQQAMPSLISHHHYAVCMKYTDPLTDIVSLIERYQQRLETSQRWPKRQSRLRLYARHFLTEGSATLVALLAYSGESTMAQQVADQARAACDDAALHRALDDALLTIFPELGQVPEGWRTGGESASQWQRKPWRPDR